MRFEEAMKLMREGKYCKITGENRIYNIVENVLYVMDFFGTTPVIKLKPEEFNSENWFVFDDFVDFKVGDIVSAYDTLYCVTKLVTNRNGLVVSLYVIERDGRNVSFSAIFQGVKLVKRCGSWRKAVNDELFREEEKNA